MSKKTEKIYKSFDNLFELQNQLEEYNKSTDVRELQDICFSMGQELKTLKFLFESLYSYNGKSTSYAKKQASKENGKKGGRPPKHITMAKKRLAELNADIEELKHQVEFCDDQTERLKMEEKLNSAENERAQILLNNSTPPTDSSSGNVQFVPESEL